MLRFLFVKLSILALVAAGYSQQKILGRVAEVTKGASVFAGKSSSSKKYFFVTPGLKLVVKTVEEPWAGVLMENGATGWIKLDFLEITENDAILSTDQPDLASRGASGRMIEIAEQHIGTPYVWGGNDMNRGIDCSGFVKQLYKLKGINLPRTAAAQALVGQAVEPKDLQPGDRLYFADKTMTRITHAGIYVGNGNFIHSARSRGGVNQDRLINPKWSSKLVFIRR
jgi:cell wall-associated NlpC family hydrolase